MMKGGITSGVVYPLAACELARTHKFVNIGGSSAGAIAACIVAAAECRARQRRLQPAGGAAGPDRADTAEVVHRGTADAAPRTPRSCLGSTRRRPAPPRSGEWSSRSSARSGRGSRGASLISVVVAVAGCVRSRRRARRRGVRHAVRHRCRLVAVIGGIVSAAWAVIGEVLATQAGMAAQGFGVCVGSDGKDAHAATAQDPGALTDWLSARIDEVAGVDRPLLMSDLVAARRQSPSDDHRPHPRPPHVLPVHRSGVPVRSRRARRPTSRRP